MDVNTAFLHGSLKEDVYVCQLEGFIDVDHPSHVYKLKKALYGLKRFDDDILVVQVYVDDIIFGSTNPGTPMEIKDKVDLDKNGTLVDATKCHSMIDALMYLTMSRHLQENFRWNLILRRKASELVLEKARLYGAVNRGSRICVSIRLLCSSPLDADAVNRLWLSL
ncbi:retrovirus-related pol polyprotein from transposon TNT 1-94 [Tanacetum coccineum]